MFRHFVPATLSLILLGAHFLRLGNLPVVVLLLVCIGLLTIRKPWAAYSVQTILALGVVVWILTLSGIAAARLQGGEPWIRSTLILATVVVFTAYSAWHFRHPRLRAWFSTEAAGHDIPT